MLRFRAIALLPYDATFFVFIALIGKLQHGENIGRRTEQKSENDFILEGDVLFCIFTD